MKKFLQANELVQDSFTLAKMIYDSGYRPEVLLVIWRGGTPVGIVLHEFLLYKGVATYHAVVKAESYTGVDKRRPPLVENLESVMEKLGKDAKVLLVDDIFDTGLTLATVADRLSAVTRNVKMATLYYKAGRNQTPREPDFHLKTAEEWIVFPHELVDLSLEEIRAKDPYVYGLLV
jgi:uncharacterized protein